LRDCPCYFSRTPVSPPFVLSPSLKVVRRSCLTWEHNNKLFPSFFLFFPLVGPSFSHPRFLYTFREYGSVSLRCFWCFICEPFPPFFPASASSLVFFCLPSQWNSHRFFSFFRSPQSTRRFLASLCLNRLFFLPHVFASVPPSTTECGVFSLANPYVLQSLCRTPILVFLSSVFLRLSRRSGLPFSLFSPLGLVVSIPWTTTICSRGDISRAPFFSLVSC